MCITSASLFGFRKRYTLDGILRILILGLTSLLTHNLNKTFLCLSMEVNVDRLSVLSLNSNVASDVHILL